MRIVYVTAGFPFGPGEAFLADEFLEMQRLGHELRIVPIYRRGPVVHRDADPLLASSVAMPLVHPSFAVATASAAARAPRQASRALAGLARSRTAVILVKNAAVVPKAGWLGRRAERWRADHIHAHWGGATATMAMLASELSGIGWSMTLHRWDIDENNLLDRKMAGAQFTRFISEEGLRRVRRYVSPSSLSKAVLIRMGIRMPDAPRRAPATGDAGAVILCPAALEPRKGQRFVIDAIAQLRRRGRRVDLWLAGEGADEATLRRHAEAEGVEGQVRFLGLVPHDRLEALYRDPQVLAMVLASQDEGVPVTAIEAMAHGVPVVATAVGGTPELLRDGSGILVPPRDAAAIGHALERLLADPELRALLALRGRARVENEFSVRTTAALLARRISGDGGAPVQPEPSWEAIA